VNAIEIDTTPRLEPMFGFTLRGVIKDIAARYTSAGSDASRTACRSVRRIAAWLVLERRSGSKVEESSVISSHDTRRSEASAWRRRPGGLLRIV